MVNPLIRSVSTKCYCRDLCHSGALGDSAALGKRASLSVIALARDPRCSRRLATTAHGRAYYHSNGHSTFGIRTSF